MDRFIYTSMNGAKQLMLRQASNNHNLANVNTTGFRADLDAYTNHPSYGPGHPSRVYMQENRAGMDLSFGEHMTTGNDLDIAINGEGFIAVQSPDGAEAYTRAGDLRISSAGMLETGAGHLVMGNGGPIAIPPHDKLEIAGDGTISIKPLGSEATTLAVIDRIKLVNPPAGELEKNDIGLVKLKNDEAAEADAGVKVTSGALEGSNVNAIEAMVNMIDLSRQFEMQIKMLKTAKETDTAAASIVRMG